LENQQRLRVTPDPVQRRGGGDDRVEMVAPDVVGHAFQRDDRRLEMRVAAHGLIEDPQVVTRGVELAVSFEGEQGVDGKRRQR
jgi:hypothetical protein